MDLMIFVEARFSDRLTVFGLGVLNIDHVIIKTAVIVNIVHPTQI
jgi:hypothetical protein